MLIQSLSAALVLLQFAAAQRPGKTPEVHPPLTTYYCTKRNGCKTVKSSVVLDQQTHPTHQLSNPSLSCTTGGTTLNATICPNKATCQNNCIVEGISDYSSYGVATTGNSMTLTMIEKGNVVSPRVYLLDEAGVRYDMLKLTGHELAFDVDMSHLPCGMNGALYLTEMYADGKPPHSNTTVMHNPGAAYGSGYCDAQCFVQPFRNGMANLEQKGACCAEMDIWEANAKATALTPHTCNVTGPYGCTGAECTWSGVCDQWGCSYNTYSNGNMGFYGPGLTVDTTKKFTVVTQFPTFSNGTLMAIRRFYVQNGKVIQQASINITGSALAGTNEIDAAYCKDGGSRFVPLGGMTSIGEAMKRGMALIFSVWWDQGGYMNWLDTASNGPCNTMEGNPTEIVKVEPSPEVTWSNIKWGDIGTTTSV